jgi:hypothetical protein
LQLLEMIDQHVPAVEMIDREPEAALRALRGPRAA